MKYSKKLAWNKTICVTLQLLLAASSTVCGADPVLVSGGNAQVYEAPNGVPVIDINTANSTGVSHNQFNHYDVDSRGLVLNNGNNSIVARQSQLAGQVVSNLNLVSEATVIINEVVQANRSSLTGYIEVLGGKADVVVVNPYGITCSGCGFINTDRVTLTTGTPNFSSGSLASFTVTKGDVLISGEGADLSAQQIFDVVARSVTLSGQVNAADLKITSGPNTYNYTSRSVTGSTTPVGTTPTYGIDSSLLGGMYANKITLVATEAGVGVRMLGDAAASSNDFTLTAAGAIVLTGNNISATAGNIAVTTSYAGTGALTVTNAQITANSNLTLTGTSSGLILSGGMLKAGNNLTYNLGTLSDSSSAADITDNNKRYAGAAVSLTTSGAATVDGTKIGSGAGWTGSFDSLSIGSTGATLYSGAAMSMTTANNMSLATGALRSVGNLSLTATSGSLTMGSSLCQGIQTTAGNMTLTAGSSLTNVGSISADAGTGALRVNGTITNTGTIHSNGAMSIADKSNAASESVVNTGTILSDGSLTIQGDNITNSGSWQGTGATTMTANVFNNGGTFIASNTGAQAGTLNVGLVTNLGTLQSAGNLNLNILTKITNSSKILSSKNLSIQGSDSRTTLTVENKSSAVLQAGASSGTLTVSGQGGGANATLNTQAGTLLGNTLTLNLSSLTNTGIIQGKAGASTIGVSNTLTNASGATLMLSDNASGTGIVTVDTLANSGIVQSTGVMTFKVGTALTNNSSASILGTSDVIARGKTSSSYTVTDSGRLQSGGLLDIRGNTDGSSHAAVLTVGSNGILLGNTMNITPSTLTVNNGGMISSVDSMTLNTTNLSFGGSSSVIVAGTGNHGTAAITVGSAFSNNAAIHGYDLTLSAPSITNTSTGGVSATHNLTVTASSTDISNSGALYAGNNLTLNATSGSGLITNVASLGTLDAGVLITANAKTFTNNNMINAGGDITVSAATFNNSVLGGDTRTNSAWDGAAENDSGTIHDHTDVQFFCGTLDEYTCYTDYYHETYKRTQTYSGGVPTLKPEIISAGTLTIHNFDTANNIGGLLSGDTVTITGNGGSNFNNNDLALDERDYTRTWNTYAEYFWGVFGDGDLSGPNDDTTTYTQKNIYSFGAGIYGSTVNISSTTLNNIGSTLNSGGGSGKEGGAASGSVSSFSKTGASSVSGVSGTTTSSGASAISFGGLTITLPTNPNGYFIPDQDPNAQYLIETNPLFAVGANSVGSDYLAEKYGYNPDKIGKRLGDANYEASLITQQIIAQTGRNLLSASQTAAQQIQTLMDQGASEAKRLGMVWGQAPTPDQLANLKEDMVWMVSVTIKGQTVLAPVVYLAQSTKDSIESGAVIAGTNVNLNVASLSNTGGTISGSGALNVVSKGDITNTSGTIKGGDVSLQSTDGSIVNQTQTITTGNDKEMQTTIGKQAGIIATGDLKLDASKNITNLGANVSAGNNATLTAGENITFDTVEDKKAHTTHETSLGSTLLSTTNTSTTTATTNQIHSGLTVGGNLNTKAGKDITLAGTDVKTGGDANLEAGGNVNILARANTSTTTIHSSEQGIGVGGGLMGGSTTDSKEQHDRNVGTTMDIGGNSSIKAIKDITFQGATVNVAGDGNLDAGDNINVLAGKDADYKTSHTTTTTFMKIDSGEGESSASAGAGSGSKSGKGASNAKAGADSAASAGGAGGLELASTTTTDSQSTDERSVGSNLNFGGNVKVTAGKTVTLQGSNLAGGGDVSVDATDVQVLAAQNISTSSTTTTKTSIGLMAENENNAGAGAHAGAGANSGNAGGSANANKSGAGGNVGANPNIGANASADAAASADSSSKLALMKTSSQTDTATDITNTGSSISSGGNMKVNAKNQLTTIGSSFASAGDMDLNAKDMKFLAANDVHETTSTSSTTSVGLYADASASASAGAGSKVGGGSLSASGKASAQAGAEGSVGLYGSNTTSSEREGSTTAVTSSITSGGNMTRTAKNSIHDQGTQIEAGGDFTQSANTITSEAARNTEYSSSSSETNTAKLGMYAEASASAGASGNATTGIGNTLVDGRAKAEADAGYGVKASYENEQEGSRSDSSEAVVSNIKVGGKVSSTSKGKTSLEGTNITAGDDITLSAASLDYKAAANTESSSDTSGTGSGEIKVDANLAGGSIGGGYESASSSSQSSTAVVGGIQSGGKLKINTSGDTHLEGTQLSSKGDTEITAGGNVTVDAAKNTQSSSSSEFNVSAELSMSKEGEDGGENEAAISGGYSGSKQSASQAVVGGIQSGGALKISAGKNATFEGTNIGATGDASVDAGGSLAFNAAHNTSSSASGGVNASVGYKGESEGESSTAGVKGSVAGNYTNSSADIAKGGSITSGGNLKLSSGGDTTLEGTNLAASGKASVDAGGAVTFKAAESTSSGVSMGASLSGGASSQTTADEEGNKTTKESSNLNGSGMNGANIAAGSSTTSKVGSISGGQGISISSGSDTTLVGTKLNSGGDTNISAGGNVNLEAAKSSQVSGAIGGNFSDGGGVINQAQLGGGATEQGVNIQGSGNLNIDSGGKTKLEGTTAKVGGTATIDAAGGIEKTSAVSGGATVGLTQVGTSVNVDPTDIQAGGGTSENTGSSAKTTEKAVDESAKTATAPIAPTVAVKVNVTVQLPTNIPEGKKISIKTADGQAAPGWVKFDPKTGAFTGTVPPDFKGALNLVVKVPQANGTVKNIPVTIPGN